MGCFYLFTIMKHDYEHSHASLDMGTFSFLLSGYLEELPSCMVNFYLLSYKVSCIFWRMLILFHPAFLAILKSKGFFWYIWNTPMFERGFFVFVFNLQFNKRNLSWNFCHLKIFTCNIVIISVPIPFPPLFPWVCVCVSLFSLWLL